MHYFFVKTPSWNCLLQDWQQLSMKNDCPFRAKKCVLQLGSLYDKNVRFFHKPFCQKMQMNCYKSWIKTFPQKAGAVLFLIMIENEQIRQRTVTHFCPLEKNSLKFGNSPLGGATMDYYTLLRSHWQFSPYSILVVTCRRFCQKIQRFTPLFCTPHICRTFRGWDTFYQKSPQKSESVNATATPPTFEWPFEWPKIALRPPHQKGDITVSSKQVTSANHTSFLEMSTRHCAQCVPKTMTLLCPPTKELYFGVGYLWTKPVPQSPIG